MSTRCAGPTDYGSQQRPIFISLCRFDRSKSGVNVKCIYQRVGGTESIVGSHQSKIHNSTSLKWQDAQYR